MVDRVVTVAMDPKAAASNEVCRQAGGIGAAGAVLLVPAGDRSLVRQMVGDHDGCARITCGQSSLQPGPALTVPLLGVIGRDQALWRKAELVAVSQILLVVVDPDRVVIGQMAATFELDQLFKLGSEKLEVGPQGAAQEADATKGDFVVFQEMDLKILGLAAHARKSATPMGVVEIVVASHVDDVLFGEHLSGAGQASALFDVPSQDHHVCLLQRRRWRRERVAFKVQVAVDEQAHGPILGMQTSDTVLAHSSHET